MVRRFLISTLAAWLACLSSIFAAEPHDLAAALEPIRAEYHLPACAAAVIKNGEITAIGAVGKRRADANVRVTIDDLWHTGSCTKTFTAALLATLIDEGKLRWDQPISEVFAGEKIHPAWSKLSIWDVATHRAGIGSSARIVEKGGRTFTAQEQRATFARGLISRPPPEAVGKFAYSNAGYGLLGAIIERVSGKPYEQMLQERIFTPLALKTAGFGPPATPGKLDQPWGHRRRGDRLVPVDPTPDNFFPPVLSPAACVHLSLRDFAKFAWWLSSNEPPILKPETFTKLKTPPQGSFYAGGMWLTELPGIPEEAVCHTGHIGGLFAVFHASRDTACVCVFNMQGDGWEWLGDIIAEASLKAAK